MQATHCAVSTRAKVKV
ncbi:hypothetical protein E2C01_084883 [Portunus trituberculatus]|uniref:Uncharacterized protein n=1 Tax=Portunus trituberculatus TaxID=210409 RepID=A0A5B7IZG6_PORTR|nr:hypothetical protein [Portunus trituberculatus]